jgi:hypothetical protein
MIMNINGHVPSATDPLENTIYVGVSGVMDRDTIKILVDVVMLQ